MHMSDRSRITLFGQGATYCAVCAPLEVSADIIEAKVAVRNCAIGNAQWKIAAGPMIDGRPNPRSCPREEGDATGSSCVSLPSFL